MFHKRDLCTSLLTFVLLSKYVLASFITQPMTDARRRFVKLSMDANDKRSKSDFSSVNPFKGSYNDNDPSANSLLQRKIDLSETMSIRKYKMSKLMERLMEMEGNAEGMRVALNENKELLLEQFEDMEVSLEPDTIFLVDGKVLSTREERFDRYREAMSSRIEGSQHTSVKRILKAMMDFVLSYDDR